MGMLKEKEKDWRILEFDDGIVRSFWEYRGRLGLGVRGLVV